MKNKKIVVLLAAIFVFGMAYADVDTPQFFVPVKAQIMVPSVTVTENQDGLNFGQILPHLTEARFVEINVSTIGLTDNPSGAQTLADNAKVDDTDANMSSLLVDPTEVLLSGTTRTAGGFTLSSDIDASVTVVFADTLILTSDVIPDFGPPETMTVTDIHGSSNHDGDGSTPITLDSGVPKYFHIGGILNVDGGQGGGTYENLDNGGLQVDIALE